MAEKKPGSVHAGMVLLAVGIVFGDIGTSPLYAFETALQAAGTSSALGVTSLILWTLFLVVTVKYVFLIMRADFHGEGGIFALMAMLRKAGATTSPRGWALSLLLVLGASLLFGDGAITPAVSVLSAMEGLGAINPSWAHLSLPITTLILALLFFAQRFGTGRLGGVFAPAMLVWFLCIAGLGLLQIVKFPAVLAALNPGNGLSVLFHGGWQAWSVVGAVVLAITGAEALYADLGHFGRTPIVNAWRFIVFPSLILNYLGQGALALRDPEAAASSNLFFLMAPTGGAREALVVLATIATIIASQALISGVFSLSSQAMNLGYLPRFFVRHTNRFMRGQIYIPLVNFLLGSVCILLVLGFRTSDALANAYGVAVTGAMIITSIAFAIAVRACWKRPLWIAALLLAGLMAIDLPLFGACLTKIFAGGFLPVLIAAGVAAVMTTWRRGRELVRTAMCMGSVSVPELGRLLSSNTYRRSPGTEVFLVRRLKPEHAVARILEQYRRVKILADRIIILMLEPSWKNPEEKVQHIKIEGHQGGLWVVVARHGYMVEPDVPYVLQQASLQSENRLPFDLDDTFFVVGRESIITCPKQLMPSWQRHLFAFMSRNEVLGPRYLNIPADRLILYHWLLRL